MNEKALQILEQYDLEVLKSYGGRGGIMLETKDGLKMIKEFAGSRAKLPLEQRVLGILAERGVCAVDQVQANKEGELVTIGDYETPYIIKDWPPGRECDPKNEEELLKSMRLLARVHRELRGVLRTEGAERRRILGADRSEELEKHNREMKRARNFIRTRQKKGEFELLYLQCAETIFQNGADALELLKASGSEKLLGSGAKAQEGVLVALNKQTGKVVWAKSLGGYCYSSPVAVYNENGKGWIIQATSDGVLMLLDGLTGETINTLQLNGTIEASPAVYQNMLVIGTTGKGTSFLYGVKID